MNKLKFFKDKKGSVLVQAIVVGALVAGLGVSITYMSSQMMKSAKNLAQKNEINQLVNDISKILQDKDSCTQTFTGSGPYEKIYYRAYVDDKWVLKEKYEKGKTYGFGSSMVLLNDIKLDKKSEDITILEIEFIKGGKDSAEYLQTAEKSTLGNIKLLKRIQLKALYSAGTDLTECKSIVEEDEIAFCATLDGTTDTTPGSNRCTSIHINKLSTLSEPSITAENYFHLKGGLAVGTAYTADQSYNPDLAAPFTGPSPIPSANVGNVHMGGDLVLNGNIIFFKNDLNNDARFIKYGTAGNENDFHIYEKDGYDIKLGKNPPTLYRDDTKGFGINIDTPEVGYDLDVNGALKVGKKIKLDSLTTIESAASKLQFILDNSVSMIIEGGKNDTYTSGSTAGGDEVATRGWVLQAIGDVLSANAAQLENIRAAAIGAASSTGDIYIRKSVCAFSDTLYWTGTQCEMKLSSFSCPTNNSSINKIDFTLSTQPGSHCTTITTASIGAANNKHGSSEHNQIFSNNPHSNTDHNPTFSPSHTHPYAPNPHGDEAHNQTFYRPQSHENCTNATQWKGYATGHCVTSGSPGSVYASCDSGFGYVGNDCGVCDCFWGLHKRKCVRKCH